MCLYQLMIQVLQGVLAGIVLLLLYAIKCNEPLDFSGNVLASIDVKKGAL